MRSVTESDGGDQRLRCSSLLTSLAWPRAALAPMDVTHWGFRGSATEGLVADPRCKLRNQACRGWGRRGLGMLAEVVSESPAARSHHPKGELQLSFWVASLPEEVCVWKRVAGGVQTRWGTEDREGKAADWGQSYACGRGPARVVSRTRRRELACGQCGRGGRL
jgi:hypothetical protein